MEEKRRQVDEEREKLEKQSRKRHEAEIVKLAAQQERELDMNLKREEILLQRQREEKEREWREQQLIAAKESEERQQLINTTRSHQIQLKRQLQAENVKSERELWEEQMSAWKEEVEAVIPNTYQLHIGGVVELFDRITTFCLHNKTSRIISCGREYFLTT